MIPSTAPKILTSGTKFSIYLLIVDAHLKIPKLSGLENITIEEVMDNMDMIQSRFGKIDEFGWCDLERISADAGTQFTSTEFKEEFRTRGIHLTLSAPEHQEMNGQVKVTWITLRIIPHSLMVYAIVLEAYIHFVLMYTTSHIFPVLQIKYLINKDGYPTGPY